MDEELVAERDVVEARRAAQARAAARGQRERAAAVVAEEVSLGAEPVLVDEATRSPRGDDHESRRAQARARAAVAEQAGLEPGPDGLEPGLCRRSYVRERVTGLVSRERNQRPELEAFGEPDGDAQLGADGVTHERERRVGGVLDDERAKPVVGVEAEAQLAGREDVRPVEPQRAVRERRAVELVQLDGG